MRRDFIISMHLLIKGWYVTSNSCKACSPSSSLALFNSTMHLWRSSRMWQNSFWDSCLEYKAASIKTPLWEAKKQMHLSSDVAINCPQSGVIYFDFFFNIDYILCVHGVICFFFHSWFNMDIELQSNSITAIFYQFNCKKKKCLIKTRLIIPHTNTKPGVSGRLRVDLNAHMDSTCDGHLCAWLT